MSYAILSFGEDRGHPTSADTVPRFLTAFNTGSTGIVVQRYGIIYVWTNGVNGKQYVGQTIQKNEGKYLRGHISSATLKGSTKLFHQAIRKYGVEAFTVEIIFTAFDKDALDDAEDFFIVEELKTLAPNGYNLKGGGSKGKASDVTKEKQSRAKKIALLDPKAKEMNLRLIAAARAAKTPESYKIVAEKLKANWNKPGEREKRSIKIKEAKSTEESKNKVSLEFSNRKWITNGVINKRIKNLESIPEGWCLGRTCKPYKKSGIKKHRWITNGTINKMISLDSAVPKGWHYGLTMKTDSTQRSEATKIAWNKSGERERRGKAISLAKKRKKIDAGF